METIETTAPTVAETLPEETEVIETTEVTEPAPAETVPEDTVPTVPETTVETFPNIVDDYYWEDLPDIDPTEAAPEATAPILIIEETEASETTEATEATEATDTAAILVQIEENTALTAEASGLIAGFSLFNVVVILCFFAYKFFRIFF